MSDWETVSGPDDGWEAVPAEQISRKEFTGKSRMETALDAAYPEILPKPSFFTDKDGGDLKTRLLYSIKLTPKGKKEFLEQRFGKDNVQINPVYSQEFADPDLSAQTGQQMPQLTGYGVNVRGQDGIWRSFDENAFTVKDIADLAGPGIDVSGNVAAAFFPGGQSVPGQMVATAAGRGVRHAASALIPGRDYASPAVDVPLDVGKQAAITGAIGLGFKGAAGAYDFARNAPTRTFLERTGKGIPPGQGAAGYSLRPGPVDPVAKGRTEAFERLGIQPSFAEATHSKMYQSAERMGATGISGSQRAFDFYTNEATKAVKNLDDTITSLGPKPDLAKFADKIGAAYDNTRSRIVAARKLQWDKAYSDAVKLTNNKPFISLPNFVNGLKEELAEASPAASASRKTIATQVENDLRLFATPVKQGDVIVDWLPKPIRAVDLKQLHNRLAEGSFVEGVQSASSAQAVSSKLKSYLDSDVASFSDEMFKQQGTRGAAGLLQEAWRNWGDASQKLGRISKDTVGKALRTQDSVGIADETIVDRALRMKPSELRNFMSILRKSDPETYKRFPQLVLYNAREKAKISPPGTTMEAPNFSMEKFMSAMPKDDDAYKMIFRNPALRQKTGDIQTVFRTYMESVGHGAPRELATELRTAAGNVGGFASGQSSWVFGLRQLSDLLGGGTVSKKMFTKKGIEELMTLSRTKGRTVAIETAIGRILQEAASEPSEAEIESEYVPLVSDYEQ